MGLLGNTLRLYEDGELEGTIPQLGAVAGRIEEILPAAEIVRRTVAEFDDDARRARRTGTSQAPTRAN